MHGLVYVTWEKYLGERFKGPVLDTYRETLGETLATAPLASRVYEDGPLLVGVAAASRITNVPAEMLLREYGYYFITNGLTRHLCAHILTQIHNGRDLLLAMHDAHLQMSRLPEGLTPPLFQYRTQSQKPDELILIYDSPRKLCSLLMGAIEGAAERYGQQVQIVEQTCMKQGDPVCSFYLHFSAPLTERPEPVEQQTSHRAKQQFAQFILSLLPDSGGVTLAELQKELVLRGAEKEQVRPAMLLEALRHLHYAGLVANTANHPGDDLMRRRYWRAPTTGTPS